MVPVYKNNPTKKDTKQRKIENYFLVQNILKEVLQIHMRISSQVLNEQAVLLTMQDLKITNVQNK